MYLRLYKEPFVDSASPRKVRLLFEGQPGSCMFRGRQVDFYLYVWIRDCEFVEAFQAVVDNEFVYGYEAPGHLTLGRISGGSMNRSVTEYQDALAIKDIQALMVNLENYQFPNLMIKVVQISGGLNPESRLSETECFTCRDLARNRTDSPSPGAGAPPESPQT